MPLGMICLLTLKNSIKLHHCLLFYIVDPLTKRFAFRGMTRGE